MQELTTCDNNRTPVKFPGFEPQQAIDLDPNNIIALRNLCSYYRAVGKLEEAILTAESILQKDPLNREMNWHLGILFRINHQVDEAIAQFNKVLELYPENQFVSLFLGITYIQKGLFEEGIELLEYIRQSRRYAENPFTLMLLCCAYAQAGDKEKAYNILDIALKKWREDYFSPYALAMMYSCLNEVDKAFEWLDIAYEKHDIIMYPIKTIPEFSVLHNDPRWFSLMRRMGLEG